NVGDLESAVRKRESGFAKCSDRRATEHHECSADCVRSDTEPCFFKYIGASKPNRFERSERNDGQKSARPAGPLRFRSSLEDRRRSINPWCKRRSTGAARGSSH